MSINLVVKDLLNEHKRLRIEARKLETDLRKMSARRFGSDRASAHLYTRVLQFRSELMSHFAHEETGLYQHAVNFISYQDGDEMLRNFFTSESEHDLKAHRVLASLTERILDQLQATGNVKEDIAALADNMIKILERHAQGEDEYIFPMIVEMWEQDQRARSLVGAR